MDPPPQCDLSKHGAARQAKLGMALEQSPSAQGPSEVHLRFKQRILPKSTIPRSSKPFGESFAKRMDLKPPPRNALDLLYRYIRPGSSLKGQEGRGFFIGEQAFLDFYLQEIVPSATKLASPLSPVPPHMPVGRSPGTCAPSLYLNAMVAFSPSRESWMKDKFYKKVGTAYIVGRVCCTVKSKKKVGKSQDGSAQI
ncbi:hypothetical protein GQ600_5934 [Phytophthora cactorum]|nr:hypothetical protein GQ600_5934 [Phytophthora cactorum]